MGEGFRLPATGTGARDGSSHNVPTAGVRFPKLIIDTKQNRWGRTRIGFFIRFGGVAPHKVFAVPPRGTSQIPTR
jgi:hypothetical protein